MTVPWFDNATLTVEIAFTTDPQDPSPSWTDVSEHVRGLSVSCGRSSEFSPISPSTLSITFDNRARQFDPEHATGPYYGNLNPMKKIRVRWTYPEVLTDGLGDPLTDDEGAWLLGDDVTYDRFTGYVQGWPQQYTFNFDSTVTVNAIDGSRFLEQAILPAAAYTKAVLDDSPIHYWPMQEQLTAFGGRFLDVVGDLSLQLKVSSTPTSQAYPLGETTAAQPAGVMLGEAVVSSAVPSAPPKALEAWFNFGDAGPLGSLSPRVRVQQSIAGPWNYMGLGDSLTAGNVSADYAFNDVGDGASGNVPLAAGLHHLAAYADTINLYVYVDGQLAKTSALTAPTGGSALPLPGVNIQVLIGFEGSISHLAIYDTAPDPTRWLAHYKAGIGAFGAPDADLSGDRFERVLDDAEWPASFRDLSAGVTSQGGYRPAAKSAMQYLRDVETSEDGLFFIDGAGDVVFRDRRYLWTAPVSATFSDDGDDVPYREIAIDANSVDPLRNKVTATYGPNDGYVVVEDTASRGAYGPATEALSIPTVDDVTTARALSAYKLRTMKDPQSRITSITVQPRAMPAVSFSSLLGIEIGDRVQVEITPVNVGSQVVKELTVQGFNERVTVGGEWDTTLYLSPLLSAEAAPYWTIGHPTRGRIGAAYGNKIPF